MIIMCVSILVLHVLCPRCLRPIQLSFAQYVVEHNTWPIWKHPFYNPIIVYSFCIGSQASVEYSYPCSNIMTVCGQMTGPIWITLYYKRVHSYISNSKSMCPLSLSNTDSLPTEHTWENFIRKRSFHVLNSWID